MLGLVSAHSKLNQRTNTLHTHTDISPRLQGGDWYVKWKIQSSNNKQLPQQDLPQRAVPLFA
jgi:hypothetical protein